MAMAAGFSNPSQAADAAVPAAHIHATPAKEPMPGASAAKGMGDQVRDAIANGVPGNKRLTLVINGKEKKYITLPAPEPVVPAEAPAKATAHKASARAGPGTHGTVNPQASRQYLRAKAAALAGHTTDHEALAAASEAHHGGAVHWSYAGETGPQAWGQLKPEFNLCAIGKRQSPINIEETSTLQGPAEALQFSYLPSSGTVVNNGHTIEVDVDGDNALTVRGSTYKLLQFHFHTPSEEQVNGRNFAMVAHLVHQNAQGQLAVVSVLLDPGVANALINKVWTYMPLDSNDRVRLPAGLIDMNELLPKDPRYYQFMGSLTTPPCTEGVLWLVFKQATPVSREQIRLFTQLFPNNARPLQALNGRAVRDAQ
jgi:carbonic anhydrase